MAITLDGTTGITTTNGQLYSPQNRLIFTTGSGTYTPTSGTKALRVICIGGGGAGVTALATDFAGGAGAGGLIIIEELG